MWTEIVRCKRLELPESDGWHKMEDKKTPKPLADKIITHLQKCWWERADLIPLHHFCIPRNICQDIIFRGSFFLNAAICKRASAICCLSKNSCVFHIHLLAASTGRVTCSQPIAIMCRLITVTPRCGDTDRLHLSERCRDTGAGTPCDDIAASCRTADAPGALKQMLSTINPLLIMLTLFEINLSRPASFQEQVLWWSAVIFSPKKKKKKKKKSNILLVCICFSYWFNLSAKKTLKVWRVFLKEGKRKRESLLCGPRNCWNYKKKPPRVGLSKEAALHFGTIEVFVSGEIGVSYPFHSGCLSAHCCANAAAAFDRNENVLPSNSIVAARGNKSMWHQVDSAGFKKTQTGVISFSEVTGSPLCTGSAAFKDGWYIDIRCCRWSWGGCNSSIGGAGVQPCTSHTRTHLLIYNTCPREAF